MRILDRALDKIDIAYLEGLLADHTPESLTHDYKAELPDPRDDAAKTRVLKSVSAFANNAGGVLVFGFDAPAKGEWSIPGLAKFDSDRSVLSLTNLLRSGLEPPLARLEPRICKRPGANPVLLLGVPRSLGAPHRVTLQYDGRFWRRSERGNECMTRDELRRAFLEFDSWEREAEAFVSRRVQLALSSEHGVPHPKLEDVPLFLHVLPLGRLREVHDVVSRRRNSPHPINEWISANHGDAFEARANLDGWIESVSDGPFKNWFQLFRHGGLEACLSLERLEAYGFEGSPPINGNDLDDYVCRVCEYAFDTLKHFGEDPPYSLHLTATRVLHRRIHAFSVARGLAGRQFDRDRVDVPTLVVDDTSRVASLVVKPALDMLWQAAGWDRGTPVIMSDGKILSSE
ncbi:MAG TPA: ATP-binding protein [Gemmatimonadaceae bacterium]|jgi:hypothetical protein